MLLARTLAVAFLVVALAGCLSAKVPPVPVVTPQEPWSHDIDFTPKLQDGQVVLRAIVLPNGGNITAIHSYDLHESADAHFVASIAWEHAPLAALQARAAGKLDTPIEADASSPFGGGGGCHGPLVTIVRANGQDVAEPKTGSCGGRSTGDGTTEAEFAPGEALLLGAAVCGFSAGDLSANDHWTVHIEADSQAQVVDLPAAPIRCGIDFEHQYDNNLLGHHVGNAHTSVTEAYGATFLVYSKDVIDGDWITPGNRTAMKGQSEEFQIVSTTQAGTVGFEVRQFPEGGLALWAIIGI